MTAPSGVSLRRELGLRDLTLFATTAIIGTRWIPGAARAGAGSVTLWVLAAVFMMMPLAMATATLSVKYPGAGGLYLWTREDFGPWHGFLCLWVYWVGVAFWFPGAAMFYMSAGLRALPRWAHLADERWWVVAVSLAAVWVALGSNLVGLQIGKWTQNLGGICSWLLCGGLAAAAWVVYARHGSATRLELMPVWNWGTLNFWSNIAFAMTGIELAGMMAAEIRDVERTLPRAALLASILAAIFYIAGTLALVVLSPSAEVSEMAGWAQGAAAAARGLGAAWIVPLVAMLVLASGVGQFGGIGTGVSRLPLAAGIDHLLPAAFTRIHPRWQTPYVAILTLGGVSSVLLLAMQVGDTARAAYQALVSLTIIGGFLPFIYIFASAWKAGLRVASLAGMTTTLFALACAVVPTAEVTKVWVFEAKLASGTAAMIVTARWLYRRGRG